MSAAYLYYICLLSSRMSAQLYDVCLLFWCLLNDVMTARLYEVWSTVRCLPTCMMFAQLDVIHLHTYVMFVLLYDVCLPVWWLLNCVMSYVFCFAKWYEAKFRKFSVSWNYKKRKIFLSFSVSRNNTKKKISHVSCFGKQAKFQEIPYILHHSVISLNNFFAETKNSSCIRRGCT